MMYCINGRFLTQRLTGVQRFAYVLVCALKVKYADLIVLVPEGDYSNLPFTVKQIGYNKGVLWEHFDLPLHLKNNGSPVLLNLCNVGPLFYSKNVITLHDIAFKINPSWFSFSFQLFYNTIIPKLLKRALQVITVSEFSKVEITSHYNIKESKVAVVSNVNRLIKGKVKEELPYLLFVGSFNPRKNLETLINAFYDLKTDFKLKVVGAREASFSEIENDSHNPNIEFLGYLNDDELDELYMNAKGFVSLSFYEGFNIPVLEALACGCNVLLSDIPVHRELYNDVAIFVDHTKVEKVQEKLQELMVKEEKSNFNKEVAARYTIEKALSQLEKALEGII